MATGKYVFLLLFLGAAHHLIQVAEGVTMLNKTTGLVYYSLNSFHNWEFVPPRTTDDDYLLVITFITLQSYNSGDSITLPDNTILPRMTIDKIHAEWCGVYSKPGSKCTAGSSYSSICDKPVKQSALWPAVMEKEKLTIYMHFSYTFFRCGEIKGESCPESTTAAQELQKQCNPMTETFAILGALLAASLALACFLLFKSITEKRKQESLNNDQKPTSGHHDAQTSTARGRSGTTASGNSTANVTYELSVKPAYRCAQAQGSSSTAVHSRGQLAPTNYENPYQEIATQTEAEYNQLRR